MYEERFTPEHHQYRKSVREFCDREIVPHIEAFEHNELTPRSVFEKAGAAGFLGARFSEACGGSACDFWYSVIWAEELARTHCAGTAMGLLVQSDMATPVIGALGTEVHFEEFLRPALTGQKIAALGITEPGAGSDVAAIKTTARRDGDDYIIDGSKTYITNGTQADFITLAVKTKPDAQPNWSGISLILFPTDTPGFTVGRKLKKLGNHSSDTAELHFDGCRVPRRFLLGEENHGFIYIMRNFQGERLVGALTAAAGARRVWERTLEYGQQRFAFGKPISKYQVWRHQLVDMVTELDAGQLLAYRAADLYDRYLKDPKNAADPTREISQAKLYCAEMAQRVVDRCLQFHGGMGYMEEYFIARVYRDTRLISIGGGTSEIMKEIIAKWMGI
ncbi:MAG: acyl-CoA dehydrogenase [Myxococcales bacterium]|nr:acyl-CoA dehydrogenase [Myxococcales bacterium]